MRPSDQPIPPGPEDPGPDPLEQLRERIRQTTEAAQRLAEQAAAYDRPPERGWNVPRADDDGRSRDVESLLALAESAGTLFAEAMRGTIPRELRQQFVGALRELLVALRALIDWYVERLDHGDAQRDVEVEDIPIS